jgi:hypothetical protein
VARRGLNAEISTVFTPLTASKVRNRLTSTRNDFYIPHPGAGYTPIRPLLNFRIIHMTRTYQALGLLQLAFRDISSVDEDP